MRSYPNAFELARSGHWEQAMERVGRSALTRSSVLRGRFQSAPRDELRGVNWPHHIFRWTAWSSTDLTRITA